MKHLSWLLAVTAVVSCSHTDRRDQWFHKEATPPGRYEAVKFVDSTDQNIQQLLVRLEKLEPALAGKDADRAENEANKIVRMLARAAERSLPQVSEHIVWMLATRPDNASLFEVHVLDFLGRCQELIFEVSGDEAPTIENLGAYCINASRRAPFLRVLINKGLYAMQRFRDKELGVHYGDLVCGILERAQWGAVRRIDRVEDPESPAFRSSILETLNRYRSRLGR